jgi:uncharacterized membrane protein YeaQ/YmgE (transglycosylase-associated protein family)
MSVVVWLLFGLAAGCLASLAADHRAGLTTYMVLGVVGAFAGGFLFSLFGGLAMAGINPYGLLVAAVGSSVVLVLYHGIAGDRT